MPNKNQPAEPPNHNYQREVIRLVDSGAIPEGHASRVRVAHDEWCEFFSGGLCKCEPELTFGEKVFTTGGDQ